MVDHRILFRVFAHERVEQLGVPADCGVGSRQTGDARTDSLSHADVYSGLHATIAVLAALRHRLETGDGQYIDVAMASVITSINERVHYDLSDTDLGDEVAVLGATNVPFFVSPKGTEFAISMSLVGTGTFDFYCNAMRRPDLKDDPRFLTPTLRKQNLAELREIIQTWIWTFEDVESLDAQLTRPNSRPVSCATSVSSPRPNGRSSG